MHDYIKQTENCLSQIIENTDYSIYDIEYVKEGPYRYLRVFIDKENGVGIDDCEYISRKLEAMLDDKDFIKQAYILEVSSPGINRRLKKESDFLKYLGHIVDIKLFKPLNKIKEYQGKLKSIENGKITVIMPDESEMEFSLTEAASVRLSVL